MMEIILVIVAFLFLLIGFLGSIIPILPGPPISYIGLLLLQWSGYGNFTPTFLWIWAAITVVVTIGDNFFPALMTRRFGGSRSAAIGSLLGLVAGMFFFPPLGLIIGSFLGALAGELIHNRSDKDKALKVALGAFLAFILSTGAKLIISAVMIFYAVKAML
ncbi:MAG: DUF456 domain-containing protein [Leptospirales bacterium]|nr:DUF456 domain-containing protein [Leptospirales bacterium]